MQFNDSVVIYFILQLPKVTPLILIFIILNWKKRPNANMIILRYEMDRSVIRRCWSEFVVNLHLQFTTQSVDTFGYVSKRMTWRRKKALKQFILT